MNALDLMEKLPDGSFRPKVNRGFVGLFVGYSGCGKSIAEASFPGPSYTFDVDNRFRGVIPSYEWLGKDRLAIADFDFYNPIDGFKSIDDKLDNFITLVKQNKLPYKTIGFASTGSLILTLALDSLRLRGQISATQGKIRGKLKFLTPDDYNYVQMAFRHIMFNAVFPLVEMGVNVIFHGWLVDRWGKKPGSADYAPAEVIGTRLFGPPNLAEELVGYFDEVYLFKKQASGAVSLAPKFLVNFNGPFAKTALGLPTGEIDITKKNFYELWKGLVQGETNG